MCGIVGTYGTPVSEERCAEALRRLRHRGPDDEGTDRSGAGAAEIWLGFRRLAIQDLSPRGNQPMMDPQGRRRIVFNGEIYNVRSLRRELESLGHRFRTTTDTEVLLAGWTEWAAGVLPRLVGMFAFAVADPVAGELFLARDHLGIKPLYVHEGPDRFAFASEVKAILPLLDERPELDMAEAARFFTFLWVPPSATLLRGIRSVPAGGWLRVGPNGLSQGTWWELPVAADAPVRLRDSERGRPGGPAPSDRPAATGGPAGSGYPPTLGEAAEELDHLLREAVGLQLIGDVPLGAFLSGGVDSTLLVALMRGFGDTPVRTHTAVFPAEDRWWRIEEDDAPWARRAQELLPGLEAHEHVLDPRVAELLPRIVWHLDDPVADPAALATFVICEAARPTTTVLLSGIGAEEVFAGYPRHRAALLAEHYQRIPHWLRAEVVEPLAARLPAARPGRLLGPSRGARKFVRGASLPFEECYLSFSSYFDQAETAALVPGAAGIDPWDRHRAVLERTRGRHPLRRMTHLDLLTFLPSLNLAYTDRASMAASVEVRVPYLDHRIVEWSRRLPVDHLLEGSRSKRVLKAVAERYLPRNLVHRRKAGFQAPVRAWVNGPLRPMIQELLSEERVRRRGVLEPGEVGRIVDATWAGREDNALRIWAFLTFEIWAMTFLDRDGAAPAAV